MILLNNNDIIYNYIYENVIMTCMNAIKQSNYAFAYSRYKDCVLTLEEEFARPKLELGLVRVLKENGLEFIPDYVLMITKMLGPYDPYIAKFDFDDIVKVEEILYSSLRWTGKIDFTFNVEEDS